MTSPKTPLEAESQNSDLVFGLEDRPKPWIGFLAALQHLLAIIVPIVTPGLLICQALGVSSRDTNLIVSMSLVIPASRRSYSASGSARLVPDC